jgi:8-oxo-dGTP pyrophosphatase MutT (NUDIX family)
MSEKDFPKGIEVVTTGFVKKGNKILLAKSDKWSDTWVLPGGHIEPGESILKSCERETEEELGLKLEAIEIINWGEAILKKEFYRSAHFIYFDVLFEIEEGEDVVKLQESELSEYDWFTVEEALNLNMYDVFKEKIRAYQQYMTDKGK